MALAFRILRSIAANFCLAYSALVSDERQCLRTRIR